MGAGHAHTHGADVHRRKLWIALAITSTVVVAQLVGSIITGSLALLTDTVHVVVDASGLLLALSAATLMRRPADASRTWGFRRAEVLAALAQASVLIFVGLYAAVEGVRRLFDPPQLQGPLVMAFGVVGLIANLASIAVLHSSRDANFNMRAAFLEVLNDALGSLGVIVAGILIATTGFQQADAIAGLLIAVLIVPRAMVILRGTLRVLMEQTPEALDLDDVQAHLLALEQVKGVHDLHASTIATGLPIVTGHIVVDDECFHDGHAAEVVLAAQDCTARHFNIRHATFQVEPASAAAHPGHVCLEG